MYYVHSLISNVRLVRTTRRIENFREHCEKILFRSQIRRPESSRIFLLMSPLSVLLLASKETHQERRNMTIFLFLNDETYKQKKTLVVECLLFDMPTWFGAVV